MFMMANQLNFIVAYMNIFKREKPNKPELMLPYEDNWKIQQFENNVKSGVVALNEGKSIKIYDDGRGYELAIRIKQDYILQRTRALAEKIHIHSDGIITIEIF